MYASVEEHANLIANQWTVAMWFRPDSLNAVNMATSRSSTNPDGGSLHLLSRLSIRPPSGTGSTDNRFQIVVAGQELGGGGGQQHEIQILGTEAAGGTNRLVDFGHSGVTTGSDNDISDGLFSWGGAPTASAAQNDAWYFLVICFEGGDFISDSPTKLRAYMNSVLNPVGAGIVMIRLEATSTDGFEQEIVMDDTDTMAYNLSASPTDGAGGIVTNVSNGLYMGGLRTPTTAGDMQVHQLGIWNIALDRGTNAGSDSGLGGLVAVGLVDGIVNHSPIDVLFNNGFGTLVDWKKPSGRYVQHENLCHLIQFGAVEQAMSTGFPGRDTGYHVYQGDLNFTGVTDEGKYIAEFDYADIGPATATNDGNHYTDNTSIADILSPDGANGTTQFDKCYPGQNL